MEVFTIPINVDFSDRPTELKEHHLCYFLDYFWFWTYSGQYKNLLKASGHVPFNAQRAKNRATNYRAYLNYLIAKGIIECDGHHDKDRHISFGYKLKEQYMYANPMRRTFKKKGESAIFSYKIDPVITAQYPYITKWYKHVDFDYDSATFYIEKKNDELQKGCVKKSQ